MSSSPSTSASLLLRIRDPGDKIAWGEFVRLYAPLIHAYGRQRGLQDADAADLAQEVLCRVSRAVPEFNYDPACGSFRGWLFRVTRNELLKMARRQNRQTPGSGHSEVRQLLENLPVESADETTWNDEYHRNLFQWAVQRVQSEFRDASWRAFWMTAVEGKNVNAVAAELGMTAGAVYIARSRIVARIRQAIASVEGT